MKTTKQSLSNDSSKLVGQNKERKKSMNDSKLMTNEDCHHIGAAHPIHPDGWSDTTILKCDKCGKVLDLNSINQEWRKPIT
jgi:hypothetical protein